MRNSGNRLSKPSSILKRHKNNVHLNFHRQLKYIKIYKIYTSRPFSNINNCE